MDSPFQFNTNLMEVDHTLAEGGIHEWKHDTVAKLHWLKDNIANTDLSAKERNAIRIRINTTINNIMSIHLMVKIILMLW